MDKIKNGSQAQGAEAPLTIAQVESYLTKDISIAIRCLDAIHSDPDLLRAIATFMHGRLMNQRHKEELKNQQKLEV